MAEGQDAGGHSAGLSESLQKEINRREAFERKNAELEGVNDELRLEIGELRTQVQMLRKKLEEMAGKPKSSSAANNTPELQKKHQKSRQPSQKRRSGTPVHGADSEGHEEEVHTLRREKKALKDELEETKAKQLSFEAAFKTEFDLRTTTEEKYDSLRERYERLVIESDEMRKVLRQHNILIPPPPSLRAKLRITADGPMKPPRRKKRSASHQPDDRPKSESVALMADNFYFNRYLPQDPNSQRASSLSPDRRHASASPSDHRQFLFTELSTIEGSCEITGKSVLHKETKEENGGEDLGLDAERRDQSNGQPLQPSRTPAGDIRKVQSSSVEDIMAKQQSPSPAHHQQGSSGSAMNSNSVNTSPANGCASELTGQPETCRSQESVGVTITVSTEMDDNTIVTNESIEVPSDQLGTDAQSATTLNGKSGFEEESSEEDKHHHIEQQSSDGTEVVAPKEEPYEQETTSKKSGNMEWELDNLMAASAQQLESAKAFYAEMHAHLKKKENSDNDSDE